MHLSVQDQSDLSLECKALILVPQRALAEPGHIRCLSAGQTGQSKHEFHALGQMALMQYEDGELTVQQVAGSLSVTAGQEAYALSHGVVVCRLISDGLAVLSNTDGPVRKYLEAANRFCTRWVRLDI